MVSARVIRHLNLLIQLLQLSQHKTHKMILALNIPAGSLQLETALTTSLHQTILVLSKLFSFFPIPLHLQLDLWCP